jgi:predicted nuclease of predicted toxin-antitoxin system
MKIYVDDNSVKASLVHSLRHAGHQISVPADLGLGGATDARHLAACAPHAAAILTRDHDDYLDSHDLVRATGGRHEGILIVRMDNDPNRDMKDRDIVRALGNLLAASVPIENEFHILNYWRE